MNIKIIKKIRKYLIENIVYVVVFFISGICFLIKDGINYTLNYISMLLGLFVPIFIVIHLYSILKALILKEKIDRKKIVVCLLLIILTAIIYLFGLKEDQRIILSVINCITGIIVFLLMLFITNR